MDDISDILYIILTVLFLIFGGIRKAFKDQKAPAPKEPERTNQNPKYDPFEEIRKYIVDEEEDEESPETVQYDEPLVERDEKQILAEKILHEEILNTRDDRINKVPDSKNEIREKHVVHDELGDEIKYSQNYLKSEKPSVDVDLRQAIIYDAILHRPDY